jgi:hypothetical protein
MVLSENMFAIILVTPVLVGLRRASLSTAFANDDASFFDEDFEVSAQIFEIVE